MQRHLAVVGFLWLLVAREEAPGARASDGAEESDARALGRWAKGRARALARPGPAEHEVVGAVLYANDVDRPSELSGPAASAVVTERVRRPARCNWDKRELAISWRKGDPQAVVESERTMGEDCCDLQRCPNRSPGGFMVHLERLCADERKHMLAGLIDPRRGVVGEERSVQGARGSRAAKIKITRRSAMDLCGFGVAKFECPAQFGSDGRAACEARALGESHEFVWRKTGAGVVLESVTSRVQN